MPITLVCSRCDEKLGEINKGKIKKDAVLLCGKCNYNLMLLEQKPKYKGKENPSDFLNDIFKT